MKKKIIILHNAARGDSPDEQDIYAQRDLVVDECRRLGYQVTCFETGRDPMNDAISIQRENPRLVFTLIEAMWEKGELLYVLPAILNAMEIPYTGVPVEALFQTTNKIISKQMLSRAGIATPAFKTIDKAGELDPGKSYILKPIWEEGSVGIVNDPVFTPLDRDALARLKTISLRHYFIEEYIDGREFNISLLAGQDGPEVLPVAEMLFSSYFDHKAKVLDYKAKWVTDSEEYKETKRAFATLDPDSALEKHINETALKIWHLFNLRGYARIDFRLDLSGKIQVLEINGNPCISPDSGFLAAVEKAGYNRTIMIERILNDANNYSIS